MTDPWTPGPWRILPDSPMDSLTIVGGDGSYVGLAGLVDNRVQVANARLIVAAPDLVGALDHVEAVLSIVEPRSHKAEYLTLLEEARAVLARVRGETGKEKG